MDLRGHWSSVCPALLRYPRRNQVAPDFKVACELSHRRRERRRKFNASLRRAFARLDHHQLVLARLVPAAEPGGLFVFLGVEAGDALLEGRELDDDEAVESLRAFEGLITPAAREH